MPGRLIRKIREGTPGVVLLLFAAVVFLAVISSCRVENVARDARALAAENRARIADIQASRVESCQQTYEGIREVFRPFFRPAKQRTAKEKSDIRKFNRIVDEHKSACDRQTRTPR